ncbi:MAG: sulfite exporter TauE/SafE family protein [Burkholderiaceae bacterium]
MDPIAPLIGFGVGVVIGITGVGGGSLMTPLLLSVFRLHPAVAIGTDLCFAALTKTAGALTHHHAGQVDWRITARLLAGSVPAAVATLAWMHFSGLTKSGGGLLTLWLGGALLLTALIVLNRRAWHALGLRLERWITPARRGPLTVACGVALGVLVSLSSIGAGAIGAALVMLLHPRLPAHRVVGTDIAHAVPLTLVAGSGYALLGLVDWALLAALLIGSLPGIWLGALLTRWLPENLVRVLLCLSLVTAAVKVIR